MLPSKGVRLSALNSAKVALTAADWDIVLLSERGSGGVGTGSPARISAAESIEMIVDEMCWEPVNSNYQ